MAKVIEACVDGASVYDICQVGDKTINEGVSKVYTKSKDGKKIPKGNFLLLGTRLCRFIWVLLEIDRLDLKHPAYIEWPLAEARRNMFGTVLLKGAYI